MVKGWIPISIRDKTKEELQRIYEREHIRNQKFGNWFDNLLFEIIENDKMNEKKKKGM